MPQSSIQFMDISSKGRDRNLLPLSQHEDLHVTYLESIPSNYDASQSISSPLLTTYLYILLILQLKLPGTVQSIIKLALRVATQNVYHFYHQKGFWLWPANVHQLRTIERSNDPSTSLYPPLLDTNYKVLHV